MSDWKSFTANLIRNLDYVYYNYEGKKRKRDLYLRRKYNISLWEYDLIFSSQGNCCAICKKRRNLKGELLLLHVDHDHRIARLKVHSFKVGNLWHARVKEIGWIVTRDKKRGLAIKACKKILLRLSVRGILCWRCNTALQKFRDNPILMIASGEYIKRYLQYGVNEGISI